MRYYHNKVNHRLNWFVLQTGKKILFGNYNWPFCQQHILIILIHHHHHHQLNWFQHCWVSSHFIICTLFSKSMLIKQNLKTILLNQYSSICVCVPYRSNDLEHNCFSYNVCHCFASFALTIIIVSECCCMFTIFFLVLP